MFIWIPSRLWLSRQAKVPREDSASNTKNCQHSEADAINSRDMELRQLRYLDAVARRRSFTQAALDLHIAQSALSQQVGRLERELGVELLRRTTRRVAVTEAGELVLARARRALAEADAVRADLDALDGLARGTLRLGGVPPVGSEHPAALIADFARATRDWP
jgi:LysR family transcriptional activator of glutamate synthase operon